MATRDAKGTAGKLAKKVLDLPEEQVPVISTVDWIRALFDFNLVASVRPFTPPLPQFSLVPAGDHLRQESVPHTGMDHSIQSCSFPRQPPHRLTFDPQTLPGSLVISSPASPVHILLASVYPPLTTPQSHWSWFHRACPTQS